MGLLQSPIRSIPQPVEHLPALFDRSPLPTVVTEGQAHVLRYVNPAFCKQLGQAPDTLIGNPLRASVQVQDDVTLALLDRVYATGTPQFAVDLARLFGAASAPHTSCAVWPMLVGDDRPDGLLMQWRAPQSEAPLSPTDGSGADELRDVNERLLVASLKAQEQTELQITLRGQAEAALTVRDEFLSIAAHELRTPVTGIKTSAQLALRTLEDAPPDNERTVRYLHGIVTGANRLVSLINDLMDVSRMRSGELLLHVTSVDLAALVKIVTLRYAETGAERNYVTNDLPASPVVVAGDAGRLEQILDNLLSNAVKYSPAGAEISVGLRRVVDGVELTVSDTGIGLTPGAQDRIFEPFGRAANARRTGLPGMGLGLHICRRIAEAHGGRMWAVSDGEGRGMTVGLWLPLA